MLQALRILPPSPSRYLRAFVVIALLPLTAAAQTRPPNPGQPGEDPAESASQPPQPPLFAPFPGQGNGASPAVHGPVRISGGVMAGLCLTKVDPVYPAEARAQGVEGTVVLAATISKDGTVQDLHGISGPPTLAAAAVDAVSQWTYKPYMLNGNPVQVRTTITVNFRLSEPAPAPASSN